MVVGSENWFPAGQDATGKAYLFTYDEAQEMWVEQTGFVPSDGGTGDNFGQSVALDGSVILIGSPENNASGGAAYVYGEPGATAAEDLPARISFELSAAFPNPFHREARFAIRTGRLEYARVSLFDLLGREVRVLHNGLIQPDETRVFRVTAGTLPSGPYVIRASTATSTIGRPIILSR